MAGVLVGLHASAEFHAVHDRHHHVADDQHDVVLLLQHVPCLLSVARLQHLVAVVAELIGNE